MIQTSYILTGRPKNRLAILDMKHVSVWLNAHKIYLNVQKTELVIFKQKRKTLDHGTKTKLNRKRLYPTPSVTGNPNCQGILN